jgi:uncharacterized protein (TIGR00255 family)
MLKSMTGFGKARAAAGGTVVEAEIRAVNHRYFKFKAALPDALAEHEADLEALVRGSVRRGSVQLTVGVSTKAASEPPRLNLEVLKGYRRQFDRARAALKTSGDVPLGVLLTLPLVWSSNGESPAGAERTLALVRKAAAGAVKDLCAAREREGRGIRNAFAALLDRMEASVRKVRGLAPGVVVAHQARLRERVQALVKDAGVTVQPQDLLREIAVFADKSDITEELQRLESHLAECRRLIEAGGEVGRRLDFLSQEILREANTMGVKAADYAISAEMVALKAELEKMKEQIENVE